MYENRIAAGAALAESLSKFRGEDGIILAVPKGGVPVAYMVAKALSLPLDILLAKKIGHPSNKEYAIGVVSMTDRYVVPDPRVSPEYIEQETAAIQAKLRNMHERYLGSRPETSIAGKTAIIVDDGIATGNTLWGAVMMLKKQKPAKLIIAVPVASPQACDMLAPLVDELICPLIPEDFGAVGFFYEDFTQLTDADVQHYLKELSKERIGSQSGSPAASGRYGRISGAD